MISLFIKPTVFKNRFSFSNLKILIVILLLLALNTLYSQELLLTYDDAIQMAIQQNIFLKQESNLLKVTSAEKQQSKANFLPSLNVEGFGDRTEGRQYSNEESSMVNTTIDRVNYTLAADLTIFNGLENVYRLNQAKQLHYAQEKKMERDIQDVIFRASRNFLQILLDKELLIIANKNNEVQNRLFEQVAAYVKIGTRTQVDLLTQEAQVKSSEVQVIKFENQLLVDKIDFAKLLVIDPENEFEVLAPHWNVDTLLNYKYSFDSLLYTATNSRPDIEQLKAEEKAAEQAVRISRSGNYPKLKAYYNYGSFYSSDYQRFNNIDSVYSKIPFNTQMFQENYSQVYGFSLSIPIFNKLSRHTEVVRSKINYENIKLQNIDFEQQLYLDIKREYQNYLSYKKSYIAKNKRAEAASQSYEKQYELYRMGKGDIITLNLENQRNIVALSEKVQAEFILLFQQVILRYYIGTLGDS